MTNCRGGDGGLRSLSVGAALLLALLALVVGVATFEAVPLVGIAYSQYFAAQVEDIDFLQDKRTHSLTADYPRHMADTVTRAKKDAAASPFWLAVLDAWRNNVLARACGGVSGWLGANALALSAVVFVALAVVGPRLAALIGWGGSGATGAPSVSNTYYKLHHKHNTDPALGSPGDELERLARRVTPK